MTNRWATGVVKPDEMSSMLDPLCERARAWASLELDDDLGDIERVLLDDHLSRCSGCATFVAGMRELTAVVRAAPQERPERPLVLPSRRRRAAVAVRVLAAATIVALAAGLAFLGSSVGGQTQATAPAEEAEFAFLSSGAGDPELRFLKAKRLTPPQQHVAPPGRQGGVV
jgi:ferric-dicitrate binding protein FerR (iron transport regulator)